MTPDLGTLSLLADDFVLPNGLAFLLISDCGHSICRREALSRQLPMS